MQLDIKSIVIILFGLIISNTTAQEYPPIETYTPKEYGADNQNWSISQSANKYIYVSNNKGLLEFNGARWQLYPSPNETIIRSVNVINNKVYTGCHMEFGFWEKNEFGQLIYTSLSKDLETPLIDDEEFWNIIKLEDFILFHSLNRIYIYNTVNKSFNIINSTTRIDGIHKVDDVIFFQKSKDGIYKIEGGGETLITNHKIVKENVVVNIFKLKGELIIATQNEGFYFMNKNDLNRWEIPAQELLNKISIYSCIQLNDKSFVLGTISNGIIHLTQQGTAHYLINQSQGLNSNTALSLFEDIDKNIWVGLDNGINCINLKSPFKIYNDNLGVLGTVYTSAVFNNTLYLGSNQGVFYKDLNTKDGFQLIKGLKGQVWFLDEIDNQLFCGHDSGTFIIENNVAKQISSVKGTWTIKELPNNPNLLLQGNYVGLHVLEKKGNLWTFRNKIKGFHFSSKFVEINKSNEVFINHEYKGVFKLKLDKDLSKTIDVQKDNSLEKGLHSSLIKFNNDILYSYKKGIFKYSEANKSFTKDTLLSKVFDEENFISGKLVYDSENNRIWSFSNNKIKYISPGKLSETPEINSISTPNMFFKGLTGYENITHIRNNKYLYGSSSGYAIIDLNKKYDETFTVAINSIHKNYHNKPVEPVNKTVNGYFKNKENNIEFNYSVSEFDKFSETEYQYNLEGIYDEWSLWSTNSSVSFNNLPYGDYTFNVKARVSNHFVSNSASYSFNIEKPWLLTNLMITVYVLGFVLISSLTHTMYRRYYKKQREKLVEESKKELALKELESEQQKMYHKNDKLKIDIESKNRELAISTMSLIKKNEFLNSVKNELKIADDINKIGSVIKLIDNNITNTDDWKFFEEAFNNADKDFLKKVKMYHPELTSNDLKLCAYLRLNLSSKEIAPLLNISSRSVEVKRYRLRKKMNLPHETSLTNYILEI